MTNVRHSNNSVIQNSSSAFHIPNSPFVARHSSFPGFSNPLSEFRIPNSPLVTRHSSFRGSFNPLSAFRIPHSAFRLPPSDFLPGFQPEKSYPSGIAFKTNGHRFSFDNDRHFTCSVGVRQHGFKMSGLFYHIIIIDLKAVFGKCCTSCPGIGSGILPENQDFIWHFSLLPIRRIWL
jgi:hypothetical protein